MLERLHLPSILALLCFLTLLQVAACHTDSLPDAIFGAWRYTGSSGGLDGAGGVNAPVDRILIRADHTIELFDPGNGGSRVVRFDAARGKTIAGDEAWFLRAGPDIPEVLRLSEDEQTMTMADNHYDGIIWHFARIK